MEDEKFENKKQKSNTNKLEKLKTEIQNRKIKTNKNDLTLNS